MKKNNFLYYIPTSGRGRYENKAEKRPAQAAYKPNSNSLMPKGGSPCRSMTLYPRLRQGTGRLRSSSGKETSAEIPTKLQFSPTASLRVTSSGTR